MAPAKKSTMEQVFVEANFRPYTSTPRPEPTGGRNSFYERTAIPPELLFRDDSDDVMRPLFIKHPGQRRGRRRALVGFVFIVLLSMCSFIVFVRIWNGAEETAIISSAVDYPSPRPTLTPSYAPTISPSASSADEPDEEEDEEETSEEETREEEASEEETREEDTSEDEVDEVDADEFSDEEETDGDTEEPDARRFLRAPDPAHTP